MRVLIVEDDDSVREFLTEILARAGHEVATTDSGFAAATLVRNFDPDAILLDIGLPFRPGTDLLEELRADERTAAVPVIIVTGLPEVLSREKLRMATAVLGKPIDDEELLALLRQICAGSPRMNGPN
jgi:DNA-binding response OmpR family regulator